MVSAVFASYVLVKFLQLVCIDGKITTIVDDMDGP